MMLFFAGNCMFGTMNHSDTLANIRPGTGGGPGKR